METEEKPTLIFNEKTYLVEELSETSKYIINQIQEVTIEIDKLKRKIDQFEVAKQGFTNLLGDELKKEEKTFNIEEGAK
jgi:prefoldin subunit 5